MPNTAATCSGSAPQAGPAVAQDQDPPARLGRDRRGEPAELGRMVYTRGRLRGRSGEDAPGHSAGPGIGSRACASSGTASRSAAANPSRAAEVLPATRTAHPIWVWPGHPP
jgi:hypothetical protein